MSKTHRRSRQRRHNGKLSRRMKKRGGTKSSLKTAQGASTRNVHMSSMVAKDLLRAPFFERVKVSDPDLPMAHEYEGQHTMFTIPTPAGRTKFTVNTKLDEEEQHKAFVRFYNKFRTIQNDMTNKLSSSDGLVLHNGQWMCVKAGNGIWYPRKGSWTMLPKKVNCDINVTDAFVLSEDGKRWISEQNDKHIFCVPENYISIMTLHELGAGTFVISR